MPATSNNNYSARRGARRGAALIVVLLLLAFFAGLIADFLYNIQINTYITANQMEQIKGKYVAEAGINASKGLLLHSSPFSRGAQTAFQNDYINLMHCRCYQAGTASGNTVSGSGNGSGLGGLEGAASRLSAGSGQEDSSAFGQGAECGEWVLDIDYPMDEYMLHLEISDEQSRLNLNALVRRSLNPEEQGGVVNESFKPVIAELIKLKASERGIELDDQEAAQMVDMMVDWEDWGQSGGAIDSDLNQSYQDGNQVYSNKNGPMDSVSELKMIPGISDDLYLAMKDFVTVYPYSPDARNFSMKVNTDMAGIGVIYAILRGSSYQQDNPTVSEEEAMGYARQIVESGVDERGFIKNREMPQEVRGRVNPSNYLLHSDISQMRWYHIKSTALSPAGVYYTIEAVIMIMPGGNGSQFLYWREG
jgi:type II secretory pathway component PulK